MKTTKLFTGLLGLALGLGLTVSTATAQAVVEKGEGYLTLESDVYIEELGEVVHESGSLTYDYHLVTTPTGDTLYHDLWLKLQNTWIGASSGTVWTLKKNVSPFVSLSMGGGVTHWTARNTYVSDTGQILEARSVFHISYDANGELIVDRLEVRAWLKK